MSFGAEYVQPPEGAHLVAVALGEGLPLGAGLLVGPVVLFRADCETFSGGVTYREPFVVTTENDVDASTGHVRGHGDGALSTGLGDDLRFTEVLLRVQDLVVDAGLREFAAEQFRLLDRRGTEQNRLAEVGASANVADDGRELRGLGLIDEVRLVVAHRRLIRRDRHDGEFVGVAKLGGFGFGGTGHARELLVETEIVLQGDRRPGVVLFLDSHALFGFDGLV